MPLSTPRPDGAPTLAPSTAPADLTDPRLTANACKVLANRYLRKDERGEPAEAPRELFWRVAAAVAAAEAPSGGAAAVAQRARTFYDLMARGEFVPNSPTLMNAGREMGMLSACFVLPVEDSIDGIFRTLHQVALIQKAGGGTGFSFSRLRPDGDVVASSGGRTSGPLSFIDAFSAATEAIQQGAFRRGANMGVLRCDHPDVVEFVRAKDDLSRWTNYNVSVAATDAWMRAASERPSEWMTVANPRDGRKAWLRKTSGGRRVSQADYEAYAAGAGAPGAAYWAVGEVLDLIIHYAWKNGEPGLLFLDRANADNQLPQFGDYEATNPCITGDSWVLTENGPAQVRELVGRACELAHQGDLHRSGPEGFFSSGLKPVLRLATDAGYELRLTAEHRLRRVVSSSRVEIASEWAEVAELRPGDRLLLQDHRKLSDWGGIGTENEGWLLGLLVGDGTLKERDPVLSSCSVEQDAGALRVGTRHSTSVATAETRSLRDLAARFGLRAGAKHPGPEIERTSSAFHRGFLRGWFDSDGSVQGSQSKGVSIRLAQSNRDSLLLAQRMLLRLGIVSRLHRRRPAGSTLLPDGRGGVREYPTLAQWELILSGENLETFAEQVGFEDGDKSKRLWDALGSYRRSLNRERFAVRVVSIAPAGVEEVYDVRVPEVRAFDANGFISHNCGEQVLPPYGSCNLGSLNLGRFLRAGTAGAGGWEERFDFAGFDRAVAESVRFLDDVVSINRFPVPEIRECAERERRIGLGVMGFADLLYGLGVAYGSAESFAIARTLARRLAERARAASEDLVAEDGRAPFGAWEGSRPQREGLPPRRNSYLTTVAPTGTISIIAGCSGGIEPMFSLAFKRQVMKNADGVPVVMTEIHPAFEAALAAHGITGARAQAAVDYALEHGTILGAGLPAALEATFVTAHDVTPEQHVRMQAAWQSAIDNAVSKTINLPHDAAVEDVRAAYLLAWQEGCKGVTVYRDGCRSMQPMALGHGTGVASAPAPVAVAPAAVVPARLPEIMPCVRIRQATPFGNMHVKISVEPKSGREMEVFAQLGKGGDLANSDLEAICRMVSLFLRIGGSLDDVVKQLDGIGSTLSVPTRDGRILSLADGLARAMHRWRAAKERFGVRAILLGEADLGEVQAAGSGNGGAPPPAYKIHCPACDDGTLIFEEGCCKCPACGYSQC